MAIPFCPIQREGRFKNTKSPDLSGGASMLRLAFRETLAKAKSAIVGSDFINSCESGARHSFE
jgi:hypothetical protein